ncbi:MAG: DUF58 domain-containing protein [Thermoplasmata archaeon]|nr:DUF58 domain-containing protein [Thermoplasmata archaeon]
MRSTILGTGLLSLAIVFAFTGILASNLSWTVLSVGILTVYVFSYRRFARELESSSIKVNRVLLDKMAYANEPIGLSAEVLNTNPTAVKGDFEDVLPEDCELSAGSNKSSRILPPRTVLKLAYSVTPKKRGVHRFPGMVIRRRDALDIFEYEQMIEHETSLSAHTEKGTIDAARRMGAREHLEFSGMGRNPAVVLREFEFDGIREYTPGDRARDIHWKLLPKTGRLMTKTYRKEGAVHTMIFVDCGRSMRLGTRGVAKVDHAVDISIQLSNVLLTSFHPAGIAAFDEINVIGKIPPSLGRHQFDKIVKLLREVPSAQAAANDQTAASPQTNGTPVKGPAKILPRPSETSFLSAVESLKKAESGRKLGMGLEGGIKETLARTRGQEYLFIIVTDLVSSRDAVVAGARICKSTGNRMLVLNTYDDWYRSKKEALDVPELERMYGMLSESLKTEAALRGLGASYLRIGPQDTAPRIIRTIRRGNA